MRSRSHPSRSLRTPPGRPVRPRSRAGKPAVFARRFEAAPGFDGATTENIWWLCSKRWRSNENRGAVVREHRPGTMHAERHASTGARGRAMAPKASAWGKRGRMNGSLQEYWNRAQQHLSSGQITAARVQYEALQARAPDHLRTLLLATQIDWNEGRVRDASRSALVAARAAQGNAEALDDATRALIEVGEEKEATAELQRATRADAKPGPFLWAAAMHL